VSIDSVTIKSFRSILNRTFKAKDLTVFVGNNDVGKSNFLKALNLFFNNQTDAGKDFRFEDDYCVFAVPQKRKAKEIIISITFNPPHTYNKGKQIVWQKKWRKEGPHEGGEKIFYVDKSDIPARSRVKVWLSRLNYKYVPAIKGTVYFSDLLRDLHDMLYLTIQDELKKAGETFVKNIQDHTVSINKDLLEKLKIENKIQLPSDLGDLFSTLDFVTKKQNDEVSLNRRGDGVKVRYIPIILKFLAEHEKKYHTKGAVRSSTIWGYEEPENNLEMLRSFELADEFIEYSQKVQIFLTTHSPAFYSIGEKQKESSVSYYVNQDNVSGESELEEVDTSSPDILDSQMGVLPIISPYIQREVQKRRELGCRLRGLKKKISSAKKPVLYVEGLTDVRIMKAAIKIHARGLLKLIEIKSKKSAGYNFVHDSLIAWAYFDKKIKVAGLFDDDEDSRKAKVRVDSEKKCKKAKEKKLLSTFLLNKPKHIIDIVKKGVTLPFSIEDMFPPSILKEAAQRNWLEPKTGLSVQNKEFQRIQDKSFFQYCKDKQLSDEELLYLKKIKDSKKDEFSKYVSKLKDGAADDAFVEFKKLIDALNSYFV